jgi:hypothetical protein
MKIQNPQQSKWNKMQSKEDLWWTLIKAFTQCCIKAFPIVSAIWSFTNIYDIQEIALIVLPSPPITMKNKIL